MRPTIATLTVFAFLAAITPPRAAAVGVEESRSQLSAADKAFCDKTTRIEVGKKGTKLEDEYASCAATRKFIKEKYERFKSNPPAAKPVPENVDYPYCPPGTPQEKFVVAVMVSELES